MKTFWDIIENGEIATYDFETLEAGKEYFAQDLTQAEFIMFIEHDTHGEEVSRQDALVTPVDMYGSDYSPLTAQQLGVRA